ncbi:MAG: hypothetical protein IKC20_06965 [Clostridia bacterium]|nr:hypothetical protein [Clostridia bacterium]
MRNHEEFVNEIYNRKETYLRNKKKTRKNIITFSIPFVIVVVLYSVMILPAMLPAGSEGSPNYEESTTVAADEFSHLTDVYTEAATSVKQPSLNGSPTTANQSGSATEISPTRPSDGAEHTSVAHSVPSDETAPTRLPEAVKPTTVSPEIFIELDRAEYKTDDKITLSITDTANVGFSYSKFVDLWEDNGGEWVLKPNNHPKPAIAYEALPSSMRDEITVSFEIDLGEYENLKPSTQYKITINIEKQSYEAYFTVTE